MLPQAQGRGDTSASNQQLDQHHGGDLDSLDRLNLDDEVRNTFESFPESGKHSSSHAPRFLSAFAARVPVPAQALYAMMDFLALNAVVWYVSQARLYHRPLCCHPTSPTRRAHTRMHARARPHTRLTLAPLPTLCANNNSKHSVGGEQAYNECFARAKSLRHVGPTRLLITTYSAARRCGLGVACHALEAACHETPPLLRRPLLLPATCTIVSTLTLTPTPNPLGLRLLPIPATCTTVSILTLAPTPTTLRLRLLHLPLPLAPPSVAS